MATKEETTNKGFEAYEEILKKKLQNIRELFQKCITNRKVYKYETLWNKLYKSKEEDLPSDSNTDDAGFKQAYIDLQRYVYYIFLTAPYEDVTLGEKIDYKYKDETEMDNLLKNGSSAVINDTSWTNAMKSGTVREGYDLWDGSKKQKKLKRSPSPSKRKRSRTFKRRSKKM